MTSGGDNMQANDQETTAQRLRTILSEANLLLNMADRDEMVRHSVEFARRELGLERCGIFLLDEAKDTLQGSFGTDDQGRTTDERALWVNKEIWPWPALQARVKAGVRAWIALEGEFTYYRERPLKIPGRGWVVATPISVAGDRLTGVMFNDSAITHVPMDEVQQDLLAVFCSLLGNILDRKKTEAALRESEERFRGIFTAAAVGTVVVSPEGRFLQANRAFCEFLGYSEAELRGKTVLSVTHPDDLQPTYRAIRQPLEGGSPAYRLEKRYLHKSGRTVWGEVSSSLVHDDKGKPAYFITQVLDIGARKQAEAERQKLQAQLRRDAGQRST